MSDVKRRQSEVQKATRAVEARKLTMQQAIEEYVTAQQELALAHDRLERAQQTALSAAGEAAYQSTLASR